MNEKYLKAPWHSTKVELPDTRRGNRVVCYNTFCGCEMEMTFHRARKDSGYADFFTAGGRSYDYWHISYWRYYSDKEVVENHELAVHDVVKIHGVGGPLEGKYGEITQVFGNGTFHVKAGVIDIDASGHPRTSVYTIAVSGANLEYDDFLTNKLRTTGAGVIDRGF